MSERIFVEIALEGAVFAAVYAEDALRGQVVLREEAADVPGLRLDGVLLVRGESSGVGGVVAGLDLVD